MMKTYSFIGSDKNAGKTTAFNHVCRLLSSTGETRPLCISSIGINGEGLDQFEGTGKPPIRLIINQFFITACDHLNRHTGKYRILRVYSEPLYRKKYILAECLMPFNCIIEGPNTGNEILMLKKDISEYFENEAVFLIDGSIDRQFIASPDISDAFYFSLLFSKRASQRKKAEGFLRALKLQVCSATIRDIVTDIRTVDTKSLIIENSEMVYHSKEIPYGDEDLRKLLSERKNRELKFYLKGALTQSLYDFMAPFKSLEVILDNFTLYLNVTTQVKSKRLFNPQLSLLNPVCVNKIFVKQEADYDTDLLPENIEIINLFRSGSKNVGI